VIHAIFLVRRAPTFARFGRFATGIAFGHHPITLQKIAKELCAKELCANANVFDLKKNWSKLLSVTRKWRGKKKK